MTIRVVVADDQDLVRLAAPGPDKSRAGLQANLARLSQIRFRYNRPRQLGELAFGCGAQPAQNALLQFPGDAELEQIAAQQFRRLGTVQPAPFRPQLGRVHLGKGSQLDIQRVNVGTRKRADKLARKV